MGWRKDRLRQNQDRDSYHGDPHPELVDLGRPLREHGLCPAGAKTSGQDQWEGRASPPPQGPDLN